MKKIDNSEYLIRDGPILFKKNYKQQISHTFLIKLTIR